MEAQRKSIGERILFYRNTEGIRISINQKVEKWQELLIALWVGVSIMCSFFIVSQALISSDSTEKTFFMIFLGAWLYFIYRGIRILIWRLAGTEDIEISDGLLRYKRSYMGLGKTRETKLSGISKFGLIKYSKKSFKKSMENYFWSQGAETIGFSTPRKYFMLGMQLNQKDAKLLSELIHAGIKKF